MGETINRFTVWAVVAQGYGLGPELARDIVNERRDNDTWPTFALACVLARRTRAINEDISAGLAALGCTVTVAENGVEALGVHVGLLLGGSLGPVIPAQWVHLVGGSSPGCRSAAQRAHTPRHRSAVLEHSVERTATYRVSQRRSSSS